MRDDKLFHALLVPITLSKYVLHQVYDALGPNGTARITDALNSYIIGKDCIMMLLSM